MAEKQHRMTRQRRIILETVKDLKTHPTADEVFGLVRKKLPRISLGTVYRNLELLTEQGIIRKLDTAGQQKRFDGDISPHYHVKCVKCGKIDDLYFELPKPSSEWAAETSFQILEYNVELLGICPQCQKNMNQH